MSQDLIARLVERRDALDPAEEAALLAALDADPALARRLVRQFATDEALTALLRPERSDLAARVRSALDSASSGRFVRQVRARAGARPWRDRLVAAAALAAAVALAWVLLSPSAPADDGPAVVLRGGGATSGGRPLAPGAVLHAGAELVAGDGQAGIGFADRSEVHLAPGTVATIESTAPMRIRLTRGALRATVSPQAKDAPAVVVTPHSEATVLGTVLEVVAGDGATRLHVAAGSVRLATGQGSVAVAAGATAVAPAGAAPLRLAPVAPGVAEADPASALLTGPGWELVADPAGSGGMALAARAGTALATPLDAATTWADLPLQVRAGVDYQVRIRARGGPGGEGVAIEFRGATALKPGFSPTEPARATWQLITGFGPQATWRDDASAPGFAHLPLRVRFARGGWTVLRLHPLAGNLRVEAVELVEVGR